MKPTQVLSNEHRVIEIVLDCLEKLSDQTRRSGKLEKEPAEQIVDFIRTFADGCHHGKEETHLFTALERKGASKEHGPVGMMLREHQFGRNYVGQMSAAISLAVAGDAVSVQTFNTNAEGYVSLLRAHIQKEDQILFPMADQMLSDDDYKSMTAEFDRVESHHMGEGTHERYLDLARKLAVKFGVDAKALAPDGPQLACGCSHKAKHENSSQKSNAA